VPRVEFDLEKLRLYTAAAIVVVWMVSLVADAIPVLSYDPPATLHALMVMTATFLFGPSLVGRSRGAARDVKPPTPEDDRDA
jgi:hypothetical protein